MQDWQNKFDNLRNQFLERSQERLETLRVLIEHLSRRSGDQNLLMEIRHLFHWCAGSGGVYGFERVTRCGLQGEQICDRILGSAAPASAMDCQQLEQLVTFIYHSMENDQAEQTPISTLQSFDRKQESQKTMLFVESSPLGLHQLSSEIEKKGVRIETALSCAIAKAAIMKKLPESLVIALPLPDGNGYELSSLVRSSPGGERIPIIFLSQQAGFLDKVAAIRCGADAFFEHPLDEKLILSRLEYLMERDRPEKYKILSMEDDPDQAEYIKLSLESAGYTVISVQDPAKFEDAFLSSEPDLVLMDVVLGPISGFELAQYIRQNDRYAALPILFLTTENALDMHIRSARIGGDDHLIKPVAPQLLAAAVAGRLERARTLKRLIDRDGLSGCLNYGPFMDRAIELMRPNSRRFSLFLLLLDVDSMHVINERLGFAVGDKVIASLGRLLSSSLRNASLIGRVSGDRFAVLLENLDDSQVNSLSQQLLQDFRSIQQYSAQGPFHCTLSISFVGYQSQADLRTWLLEAEKLLKEAKDSGGNQVRSSSSAPDWSKMRR